ncbi:Transcription factor bHLH110 [Platanthera zijinensis]|uniref:Transcription factor bHLH110 n=1 Tax=Platanthera zijinensis TaxID=2320716 RepID=A0AAP0AU69_9ASPA
MQLPENVHKNAPNELSSDAPVQKEYILDELFPNDDIATDRIEEDQDVEQPLDIELEQGVEKIQEIEKVQEVEGEQRIEGEPVHVETEQHGTEADRVHIESTSESETEEARLAKRRKLVVFKRRSKTYKQALQTTPPPPPPEVDYNKFLVDLQVKLDDHRVAIEKYVDERNKTLQFDLAQDIKSIQFQVNLNKTAMTDCFHKGGNAVVYLAKQQQDISTKVDDIALKQGYVLENQIRMNDNLTESHNEIIQEVKKIVPGMPADKAKEMAEFDKNFQAAIASVKTAITTSQQEISEKLQKLRPFFKEGVNYLDGQIRFQKEDLRDHVAREAIKGERMLIHAGSEHAKWVTNSIRATLGYPPLCDDNMVAESGLQTGLLEGDQPEVAQVIYPPPDFDMLDQQVQYMYSPSKEVVNVIFEKVDKPEVNLQEQQDALLSKKRFREQAELKPDFEQWSPTSRNIILTAWKAVKDKVHERGKWYNEQEWQKYEARQEAIVQFRRKAKMGRLPTDAMEPSKYFPKPFHYFERQRLKEEAKKKADLKGKKMAEESEAPVTAKIKSGQGINDVQGCQTKLEGMDHKRWGDVRSYSSNLLDLHHHHPPEELLLHWNYPHHSLNGGEVVLIHSNDASLSNSGNENQIDPSFSSSLMVQDFGLQQHLAKIKGEEQIALLHQLGSYSSGGFDPLSFGMFLPGSANGRSSFMPQPLQASDPFSRGVMTTPCHASNIHGPPFFDGCVGYGIQHHLHCVGHEMPPSDLSGVAVNKSSSSCSSSMDQHKASKRPRVESRPSLSPFKVRKEKLGDRIAALQQLVAPFGKTDTASVLTEAVGYIKFLQDQVEVSADKREEAKPNLRTRGLCLVPLSCTLRGNDTGPSMLDNSDMKVETVEKMGYELLGFFGGILLAILSAYICQRYHTASLSSLISLFFETFCHLRWPDPVILQVQSIPFKLPKERCFMPILFPCSPFD